MQIHLQVNKEKRVLIILAKNLSRILPLKGVQNQKRAPMKQLKLKT